ncbi:MAG: 3,4-dihydroxy 2-butanone 4-phosphate synthase/GTP cyclohydrolase II [Candidatus Azotimanducaceae bacterium]|jgi:3,4-dihydroxy 2-butanone 4-phosphate synthase/GTP cyclohydrolase II
MALSSIEDAIKDFAEGKLIIVVDDEDRENEGDLILAAEKATPENIAFMIRHTSGIICAPAEEERLNELELPIMVEQNSDPLRTAFTVSTDYMRGMTTGVSAVERANTLRALADGSVAAADFIKPGHIFPLRYRTGGVLVRSGHTEAAIDLCKLAELKPVGALAELNHDDGTMMRMPALIEFAEAHGLHIISIESLIKYRAEHDVLVSEIATSEISLNGANYQAHVYKTVFDGKLITAIVKGNIESETPTLVRVIKGSNGRDFMSSAMVEGNVISNSLKLIADAPQGVFIYLPPSEETEVEDEQSGAVWREVGLGSHILSSLGVRRIHLLASKELTYPGISSFGLHIETIIKED